MHWVDISIFRRFAAFLCILRIRPFTWGFPSVCLNSSFNSCLDILSFFWHFSKQSRKLLLIYTNWMTLCNFTYSNHGLISCPFQMTFLRMRRNMPNKKSENILNTILKQGIAAPIFVLVILSSHLLAR